MFLGYIIGNDHHGLLKRITDRDLADLTGEKPTIIVGFNQAVQLYPNITPLDKVIDRDKKICYCFSSKESDQQTYDDNLNEFLSYAFQSQVAGAEIRKIIDIDDIPFQDIVSSDINSVFLYETQNTITLTHNSTIYYINKEVTEFFHSVSNIFSSIYEHLTPQVEVLTWNRFASFKAILKNNMCYVSEKQLHSLLKQHGDVDLYMGFLCLKWSKELQRDDNEIVWRRAYCVEDMLSNIEIKIDVDAAKKWSYRDNGKTFESILKQQSNGYITQKYNGTDKLTGRMYAKGKGFSIQTLAKKFRNIVIAEPECYLIEFDYDYFEYYLLAQVCGFNPDVDPHSHLSLRLFGSDDAKYRKIAKGINYSTLYGKSMHKVVDETLNTYDIELTKKQFAAKLNETIRPVQKLRAELGEKFEKQGYIVNRFGRKIIPEKKHAVLNNYIQSTAADIVIVKLQKIEHHLLAYDEQNTIVLQNHDSILLNLRIDDVEQTDIAQETKDILESPEQGLYGKVDIEYGINWREID